MKKKMFMAVKSGKNLLYKEIVKKPKTIREHVFSTETDCCIYCGVSSEDDCIAPEPCIKRTVSE